MSIVIYWTINKWSIVEFLERNGIISLVQIVSNEFLINEADHRRMLLSPYNVLVELIRTNESGCVLKCTLPHC
jgi:hypothetical protein